LILKDPLTASIALMERKPYNPRDDLESLAYTFMFLVEPSKVPWANDSNVSIII
jgi:hypothetical protein